MIQIAQMVGRIRAVLGAGVAGMAFCLAGCLADCEAGKKVPMAERTIEQVQAEHEDEWMAIPGVEGVGIGLSEGKPCIRILSSTKASQLREKIPATVEGYPVVIEESGTFRAL